MYSSRPRNDPHFSSCKPQNHSQLILGIEWHPRTMDQLSKTVSLCHSLEFFNGINLGSIWTVFFKALLPNRPFCVRQFNFFCPKTISIVAIIKTKSAAIAFFSSSPFFLLALSFSPFLNSLRFCDFGAYRGQKTCLIFTQMTADFVRLVFKKLRLIYTWLNLCKHGFSECLHMCLVPRISPSPPRTPSNCLRLPLSCATVVSRGLIQLSRAK